MKKNIMLEDLKRIKGILTHTLSKDVATRNYYQYTRLLSLFANTYGYVPENLIVSENEMKRLENLRIPQGKNVMKYANWVENNKDELRILSKNNSKLFEDIDFFYVYAPSKYKVYNIQNLTGVLYDFCNYYGYLNLLEKYLIDDRIKILLGKKHHSGEFVYLPYFKSGFIRSEAINQDSGALNVVAHELGHAIDAETCVFPQQKKKSDFHDIMLEVPSTCMELLFDDFIINNHIDEIGGLLLKNQKGELLKHYTLQYLDSLCYNNYYYSSDGNIIDLDTYQGYDGFRSALLYGLGYQFAYHLLLIAREDKNEFRKIYNNLITSRFENNKLSDSIKMIGYKPEEFLSSSLIKRELSNDLKLLRKHL